MSLLASTSSPPPLPTLRATPSNCPMSNGTPRQRFWLSLCCYSRPPHAVRDGQSFVSISCGDHHTAAVTAEGTLFQWGNNTSGELGLVARAQQVQNFQRSETVVLPTVGDRQGYEISTVNQGSADADALLALTKDSSADISSYEVRFRGPDN